MKPDTKKIKPVVTVDETNITLNWGKTNPRNYTNSRLYMVNKDGSRKLINPMTLQEQIKEVMEEFGKQFVLQEDDYCGNWLRSAKTQQPVKLPNEIQHFIGEVILSTAQLTYERIRPEEKKPGANTMAERHINFAYNTCLAQLDANWKAWKGEDI